MNTRSLSFRLPKMGNSKHRESNQEIISYGKSWILENKDIFVRKSWNSETYSYVFENFRIIFHFIEISLFLIFCGKMEFLKQKKCGTILYLLHIRIFLKNFWWNFEKNFGLFSILGFFEIFCIFYDFLKCFMIF